LLFLEPAPCGKTTWSFFFVKSAKEFTAKEKLEIVPEVERFAFTTGQAPNAARPLCGRAAPVVETSFHYGASKLRGLVFAAAGGEKSSNYFQYRAHYKLKIFLCK
jgi:hypothetical protein